MKGGVTNIIVPHVKYNVLDYYIAQLEAVSEKLLNQHRAAIDKIDVAILNLLNQRASYARKIGDIKEENIIYRPEREAQVLRRLKALNLGPLSGESVARLFREVMSECLALEKKTVNRLPRPGRKLQSAGHTPTFRARSIHSGL